MEFCIFVLQSQPRRDIRHMYTRAIDIICNISFTSYVGRYPQTINDSLSKYIIIDVLFLES